MTTLEAIVAIVAALAWPAALVVSAWIVKRAAEAADRRIERELDDWEIGCTLWPFRFGDNPFRAERSEAQKAAAAKQAERLRAKS